MPWSNGWTTEISIPPQRVNVPDNWSLLWNELLIEFSAIAMSHNYRVGTYLELPPSLEFTHNLRISIDFVNCVSLYKLNEYWSGVNRNTELLLNEHCWRQTYWFQPRNVWKSTHRPGRCRDSGCNDSWPQLGWVTSNLSDYKCLLTLIQTTQIDSTYQPRITSQELLATAVDISYLMPPPQLMHLHDKSISCILQKETMCTERTKGFQ